MILLAAALGWISNVAALANTGASANYLILPWLLTLSLVPAGLNRIEEWAQRSSWVAAGLILLGVLMMIHQRGMLVPKPDADLDASGLDRIRFFQQFRLPGDTQPRAAIPGRFLLPSTGLQNCAHCADLAQDRRRRIRPGIGRRQRMGRLKRSFWWPAFAELPPGTDTLGELKGPLPGAVRGSRYARVGSAESLGNLQDSDISRIFRQPCRATDRLPQLAPGMR